MMNMISAARFWLAGLLALGISTAITNLWAEQVLLQEVQVVEEDPFDDAPAVAGAPAIAIKKTVKANEASKEPAKPGDEKKEEAEAPRKAAVPVDPELVRLDLMDGSGITGKLSVKQITVETKYGNLQVPITEIKSFTPGLDSYPQVGEQLKSLIKQLGSEDYAEREQAHKELTKLGSPIRAELQQQLGDDNAERVRHVKAILTEFEQQAEGDDDGDSAKRGQWIHDDTVETVHFTVVGKIAPKTFEISSKYGPLKIQLADVRRAHRDSGAKEEVRKTVSVEGTNLVQRGFKNSNVRLERGDKVSISADGQIVMTPWGSEMVSTPEGGDNFGAYMPQIPGGALVAKIGDSGTVFKLGSKHTFVADRSGVLQLAVAMQAQYARNNYQFPGKYDVKIRVEPR